MSLTVTKRYGPVRVVRAFFEAPEPVPACDVLRLRQVPSCSHVAGWRCSPFNTLLIDLTQSEEQLWRSMHGKTRERIRRAMKRDGLTLTRSDTPSPSEVEEFSSYYDRFAEERGLGGADREALEQFRRQQVLSVSKVTHPEYGDVVRHLIVVTLKRARGWHAVIVRSAVPGEEAALLGRANRLLFWDDLAHFQKRGIPEYDFGGLYRGGDDPALARIAEFKLGFGGRLATEFKCTRALTWRGDAFLAMKEGLERARRSARRVLGSARPTASVFGESSPSRVEGSSSEGG